MGVIRMEGNEEMAKKVFYSSMDGVQICAMMHEAIGTPKGNVVLAHGITMDKDEDADPQAGAGIGAFVQLADALCNAQYNVLRFDFRGHGESGGLQEEMTIAGELLDLTASMDYAKKCWPLSTALVAASFGATSSVMYAANRPDIPCMVLWDPALDLRKTLLEPILPWGKQSFNAQGYAFLEEHGYMLLAGFFKLGRPLIDEMKRIQPLRYMKRINCPVLTLHGDRDTYVPYVVSKKYARCNSRSEFVTVSGSEHGFGRPRDRQFVIPRTVKWIQRFVPQSMSSTAEEFLREGGG